MHIGIGSHCSCECEGEVAELDVKLDWGSGPCVITLLGSRVRRTMRYENE
jgi:hypothetical protein